MATCVFQHGYGADSQGAATPCPGGASSPATRRGIRLRARGNSRLILCFRGGALFGTRIFEACATGGKSRLFPKRQQHHAHPAITGRCFRVPGCFAPMRLFAAGSRRAGRARERRLGDAWSIGRRRPGDGVTRAAAGRVEAGPFFVPISGPENRTNGKYTHSGCTFRLSYFSARMLGPEAGP